MLDLTLLQLKVLWEISKKDSCGYDILKSLNEKITHGTLYPLLQSLEKADLIQSKKAGIRGKKDYKITTKGKKELQKSCVNFCKIYNESFKEFVCEVCKK